MPPKKREKDKVVVSEEGDACLYGTCKRKGSQWKLFTKSGEKGWRDLLQLDCGGGGHCGWQSIAAGGSDLSGGRYGHHEIRGMLVQALQRDEDLARFLLEYRTIVAAREFGSPLMDWTVTDRSAIESHLRSDPKDPYPPYELDQIALRWLARSTFFQQHNLRIITLQENWDGSFQAFRSLTTEDDYQPDIQEETTIYPSQLRYILLYNIREEGEDMTLGHWVLVGVHKGNKGQESEQKDRASGRRNIRIVSTLQQLPEVIQSQLVKPTQRPTRLLADTFETAGWIGWRGWALADDPDSKSGRESASHYPTWFAPALTKLVVDLQIRESWVRNWERFLVGTFFDTLISHKILPGMRIDLMTTVSFVLLRLENVENKNEAKRVREQVSNFTSAMGTVLPDSFSLTDATGVITRLRRIQYGLRHLVASDLQTDWDAASLQQQLGLTSFPPWKLADARNALVDAKDANYALIDQDSVALAVHYVNGISRTQVPESPDRTVPNRSIQELSIVLLSPQSDSGPIQCQWVVPRYYERVPLPIRRFIVLMRASLRDSWSILGFPRVSTAPAAAQSEGFLLIRILSLNELPLWIVHQLCTWKELRESV